MIGSLYQRVARFAGSGDSFFHTLIKILLFLVPYPFFILCIYLDRKLFIRQPVPSPPGKPLKRNPLIPFPRRPREIREDPKGLFDRIARFAPEVFLEAAPSLAAAGPVRIVFASASTFAPLQAEPDKNEAVIRVVFKYYLVPGSGSSSSSSSTKGRVGDAAKEHQLDVFVKTPSVREFSISLKALSSTFSVLPKEVTFYSKLYPAVVGEKAAFPLPVPSPIYAEWSRLFECYIVVTRTVQSPSGAPYTAIPDWRMRDLAKMRHMMRVIAKFHASTWELKTQPRQFDFAAYFPGEVRSAVAWINAGMSLFFAKRASEAMKTVWAGVSRRLQHEPLVMSHGDYRPGNMLWMNGNEGTASAAFPTMVATDLELAVVTPYMWDASYAMYIGLPVDLRREHEVSLLQEYTAELKACLEQGGRSAASAVAPGSAESVALHRVMGLALVFYGWTIAVLGEMPTAEDTSIQGNTAEDGKAWQERMVAMVNDIVGDAAPAASRAQIARELGLDASGRQEDQQLLLKTFHQDIITLLNARKK